MKYSYLGSTELYVSQLCFGALTIGPLQAKLPLQEGANVICAALDAGVNFIDTAELYETYGPIAAAIAGRKNDVVIASKSYAYSAEDMENSVAKAIKELNREWIDIFLLHEQSSRLTMKGHRPALEYLVSAKKKGLIRSIGVSTHTVDVVKAAALISEIDVIHPILNMQGIGICDGTVTDMISAIQEASNMGKGIYAMKALGGGHLSRFPQESFQWVLAQPGIQSIAVGMQTVAEVAYNIQCFNGHLPDLELEKQVVGRVRHLLIEEHCRGCGSCVQRCPMGALVIKDGIAVVNEVKCVLCGYCGSVCSEFCIKVV